jgi:hypothetical protein
VSAFDCGLTVALPCANMNLQRLMGPGPAHLRGDRVPTRQDFRARLLAEGVCQRVTQCHEAIAQRNYTPVNRGREAPKVAMERTRRRC